MERTGRKNPHKMIGKEHYQQIPEIQLSYIDTKYTDTYTHTCTHTITRKKEVGALWICEKYYKAYILLQVQVNWFDIIIINGKGVRKKKTKTIRITCL